MTKESCYKLHNILRIRANIKLPIPEYFRVEEKITNPDLEISQENLDDWEVLAKRKAGFFSYYLKGTAFCVDFNTPLLNTKLIIDDLQGKTKVKFTKAYAKFGDLSRLLSVIIRIKAIQKGYAFVHAGSLSYRKDQAFLFTALGETGKTSTILSLLDGKDFKFMSDDLTIVSKNGIAYSYPAKVRITPHTLTGNVIPSNYGLIKNKLARSHLLTLLSQYLFHYEVSKDIEVPCDLIEDWGKIKKVFILSGWAEKKEIREVDVEDAFKKLLSASIGFLTDPLNLYQLQYLSYASGFDLIGLFDETREIIRSAIKNAECFEVVGNDAKEFIKMIKEVI
ncbi:MAG: hypothetical protein J7K33_01535 [Candidatus Marinimicrobia bacterium]|nr:hypothetical protein [Candidatus Neomarinimicrobiota bacterium]